MRLPENIRDKFKAPLGKLILEKNVTKQNILKELSDVSAIITVGDVTLQKIQNFGLTPILQIIDGKTKRGKYQIRPPSKDIVIIRCENPAGGITPQCIKIIKESLSKKSPIQIQIHGEEDLLVLPACLYAPDDSAVLYGQPDQGLVIVHVNSQIKNKAQKLLELME